MCIPCSCFGNADGRSPFTIAARKRPTAPLTSVATWPVTEACSVYSISPLETGDMGMY